MKKLLLAMLVSVAATPASAAVFTTGGTISGTSGANSFVLPTLPENAQWHDLYILGSFGALATGSVTIENNWCPECGIAFARTLNASISVANLHYDFSRTDDLPGLYFFSGNPGDIKAYTINPNLSDAGFLVDLDLRSVTDAQLTVDVSGGLTFSYSQMFNVIDNGDLQTVQPHYQYDFIASYEIPDAVPEPATWGMFIAASE